MSHEAPKAGVVSVSKGFSPEEHNFLSIYSTVIHPETRYYLAAFSKRKRVIMAVNVWGAGAEDGRHGKRWKTKIPWVHLIRE